MEHLHEAVSRAILDRRQELSEAIIARQYARQAAYWNGYEPTGRSKSLRDAGYHLTYLAEAVAAEDRSLFTDYVGWVKVLFAGLGFTDAVLPDTLQCTREVLHEALPPPMWAVVEPHLAAADAALPAVATVPPSFLGDESKLTLLAHQYLEALLAGDRHTASRLILSAVESGASVRGIYLHVFQPVQREIGRLWQTNQVSVAQEHFCTAATQLVMSQLYPYIFSANRINRRLVATCIGGELHEIGMRMVADFFEMDGWDTYFMGANTPLTSIMRSIQERQADLLAISATMTFHVRGVNELIAAVRDMDGGRRLPILVGGYPFNVAPQLWRTVGADGYAVNAQEAVAAAMKLVD